MPVSSSRDDALVFLDDIKSERELMRIIPGSTTYGS